MGHQLPAAGDFLDAERRLRRVGSTRSSAATNVRACVGSASPAAWHQSPARDRLAGEPAAPPRPCQSRIARAAYPLLGPLLVGGPSRAASVATVRRCPRPCRRAADSAAQRYEATNRERGGGETIDLNDRREFLLTRSESCRERTARAFAQYMDRCRGADFEYATGDGWDRRHGRKLCKARRRPNFLPSLPPKYAENGASGKPFSGRAVEFRDSMCQGSRLAHIGFQGDVPARYCSTCSSTLRIAAVGRRPWRRNGGSGSGCQPPRPCNGNGTSARVFPHVSKQVIRRSKLAQPALDLLKSLALTPDRAAGRWAGMESQGCGLAPRPRSGRFRTAAAACGGRCAPPIAASGRPTAAARGPERTGAIQDAAHLWGWIGPQAPAGRGGKDRASPPRGASSLIGLIVPRANVAIRALRPRN